MKYARNLENKMTMHQAANTYADNAKMTEAEWKNYNNCINGEDFDEPALVKTLSDFKAVIPWTLISDNEAACGHDIFEVSKKTLLNYCYYYINMENDKLPEKLPSTIKELVNYTIGIYNNFVPYHYFQFALYANQSNDKFQCLVNLWSKYDMNRFLNICNK